MAEKEKKRSEGGRETKLARQSTAAWMSPSTSPLTPPSFLFPSNLYPPVSSGLIFLMVSDQNGSQTCSSLGPHMTRVVICFNESGTRGKRQNFSFGSYMEKPTSFPSLYYSLLCHLNASLHFIISTLPFFSFLLSVLQHTYNLLRLGSCSWSIH